MIKSLKTIGTIFFILLATTNGFSQTDGKDVSITASGSGKTLGDAKQDALLVPRNKPLERLFHLK